MVLVLLDYDGFLLSLTPCNYYTLLQSMGLTHIPNNAFLQKQTQPYEYSAHCLLVKQVLLPQKSPCFHCLHYLNTIPPVNIPL